MPKARPAAVERNRVEAGALLLDAIEIWSRGDRRAESQLGHLLFRHPGYVPLLRKRLTVTPDKEAIMRAFIAAFPATRLAPKAADRRDSEIHQWLRGKGIFR